MDKPKKILIVYTDAGGGHKATAQALKAVLDQNTRHRVTLMNPYKELIADVDLFARLTPYTDENVYNRFVLDKGWNNLFCLAYFAVTLLNVRLGTRESVKRFTACWKKQGFDLVISVMPMSNQGLYQSVAACFGKGAVPFLVVITDFAESMRYSWFPKEKDYFILCGTQKSLEQALAKPHPAQRVFPASGLIVHPRFYQAPGVDVARERKRLGLSPDRPTACIMYGGGGAGRMADIARALCGIDRKIQAIFLCGRNQDLAQRISALPLPYPHVIQTFTSRVPYYFSISDFLVGKPGPGTISEALVAGILPMVDAGQALPQERYNLDWLKQHQKGRVFKSIRELMGLIRDFEPSSHGRPGKRGGREALNQAVFQIPKIVEQIFSDCGRKPT